ISMASASLLPFFRLRRIIPPQTVYAVEGGDRSEWWFTFHAGWGTPGWLLLRLCRNSPSALTPPLQPSALAYVRWAVVSLPYDMGKSINFTPTLQSAAQSKKEAPETGASLRLL
ncbi:MAG: hypothetical protein ACLVB4_00725, partial [Butyricicoccus sp.]